MANEWLRLWHDMPNDPKWRTIARISGQPLALVQAVFLHLMVDASRNVTRGHVSVTHEDLASALDVTHTEIEAIFDAMQGRVIDGDVLTGWDRRQPKREDLGNPDTGTKSAAERKRQQRQRDRDVLSDRDDADDCVTDDTSSISHAESRKVTTDKDKDKDKETTPKPPSGVELRFERFWSAYPKKVGKDAARRWWGKRKPDDAMLAAMLAAIAVQAKSAQWAKDGGQYIPHPTTWLNEGRWQDDAGGNAKAETSRPQWALDAGFPTVWEAENALCFERNAHEFRDGKRIGVAA